MPPTIESPPKDKAAEKAVVVKPDPNKIDIASPEQSERLRSMLGHLAGAPKRPRENKPKEPETPTEKPAEKAAEPTPAEKAKADELAAKEKMAKVRAAKTAKAEAAVAPSATEIATAVAREVVTAIKKDETQPPDKLRPEPAVEYPWLTDKQRKKLPVLERMEKGLGKKVADSIKALSDYQAKWEKEHDGETYDAAAEEHNEFYAKNEVDYDAEEYAEAAADIRVEAIRKEQTDREQAATEQQQFAERARGHEATAAQEANRIGNAVAKDIGEGYEKIFDANGALDQAACKELDENDPVITPIIFNGVTQAQLLAAETTRMFNGTGTGPDGKIARLDMGKLSPMQRDIVDFAVKQENEMLALPAADQRDERGRTFTTSQRFYAMSEAERAKYWTFSAKEINELRGAEIARVTKEHVKAAEARLEKSASKRKFVKAKEGDETAPPDNKNGHGDVIVLGDDAGGDKPDPVTTTIGTRTSSDKPAPVNNGKTGINRFFGRYLGVDSK